MNKFGKRMSLKDKDKALNLYNEGKSAVQISKTLGFSDVAISRYLRSLELEPIPTGNFTTRKFTMEELIDMKERYAKEESLESIGKAYKAHADTISMNLKRIGIEIRPTGTRLLTAEMKQTIVTLYSIERYTVDKIAKTIGMSETRVSNILKTEGFELGKSKNRIPSERQLKRKLQQTINNRLKNTGVTLEQYQIAFDKQQGKCAICSIHQDSLPKLLSADHCHKTGKFRGLLCHKCNTGLGMLGDDILSIKNALKYLNS